MNGVEAIRQIRAGNPDVPIGILSFFETEAVIRSALRAGANGYVAKDTTPAALCDAAVTLAQAKASPTMSSAAEDRPSRSYASLTTREAEVLRALASGASNALIAQRLGISEKTLRNHISHTYRKLGVSDRAQAMIVALRMGVVEVSP
jgi:DNA-binding NarL/FixJ family response regulator